MVRDILARDGKNDNLFLQCALVAGGWRGKDDRKPDALGPLDIAGSLLGRDPSSLAASNRKGAGGGGGGVSGDKGPLLEKLDDLGLPCLIYDGEGLAGGLEGTFSAMVVLETRVQDIL